jgi:hypothetical protein
MAFTFKGYFGPCSLAPQYGGQPGAVQIFTDLACSISATLYNGRSGSSLANPLPVSTDPAQTGHFPGVDILGNVLFWAVPGWYYMKVNNAIFQIVVEPDPQEGASSGGTGV